MSNWGRKLATIGLLFVLAVVPLGDLSAVDEASQPSVRLMVELKEPDSQPSLEATAGKAFSEGIREIRRISKRPPREYFANGDRKRAQDLRRWRVIEVEASEAGAVTAELLQNPAVVSVHEEQIYEAALIPNDTRFAEQIGLHTEAWPLDINAPEAWDRTTGSGGTVIAIVDGGVDLMHEDLRDKIWVNSDEVAGNGADDDGNGFVDDVHGWDFVARAPAGLAIHHATHVAGIAAASGNNGVGVAGVDWGARIMSVRVLSSSGFGGEAGIVEGINYAVANGAKIINLSLVGPASPALSDAVENAYAAGVVVVAAAGNSGVNTDRVRVFPACADVDGVNMVLGVGAIDDEGEPARFSNYGRCVDVSAPGKDILSTKVGNRYGTMTGTSMSSPFVAGVAGLYLSLKPGASPAEVIGATAGNMTAFVGEKAAEWQADYKGRLNAAGVVGPVKSPDGDHGVNSEPSSGGDGGGGGESDSGGGGGGDSGGGGGGSSSATEEATADAGRRPKVAGASVSAADRKAPDFIQNKNVPAVVERLFFKIWGRKLTHQESVFWKGRARSDKATEAKLRTTMGYYAAQGKTMGKR